MYALRSVGSGTGDSGSGGNSSGDNGSGSSTGKSGLGGSSTGGSGSVGGSGNGSGSGSSGSTASSAEQTQNPVVVKRHYIVQFDINGGTKLSRKTMTLYIRWTKAEALAKPASLALSSKKKGQIWASFQKISSAAGYQVEYSASNKFTLAQTKEAGASAKSKTITGLKAGKKYYVRVWAYSVDSMGNRIYGVYSAVKSVKVKK